MLARQDELHPVSQLLDEPFNSAMEIATREEYRHRDRAAFNAVASASLAEISKVPDAGLIARRRSSLLPCGRQQVVRATVAADAPQNGRNIGHRHCPDCTKARVLRKGALVNGEAQRASPVGGLLSQDLPSTYVRCWPKAEMPGAQMNVCFWKTSGSAREVSPSPLLTQGVQRTPQARKRGE